MELAKVKGSVVASKRVPGLNGVKLLLIQPIDHEGKETSDPIVACDSVQAGVRDTVYWIGGREATLALPEHFVPVDATIVGIVDEVSV